MPYSANRRPRTEQGLKEELIRDAAFVAYEGQKARALSEWVLEQPARRVFYVFDTDVIKANCAPWVAGPLNDDGRRGGYGQILPIPTTIMGETANSFIERKDESHRASAVCWLLARKAFDAARDGGYPILQTRSHHSETVRIYSLVKEYAKVEANIAPSAQDKRRELLEARQIQYAALLINNNELKISNDANAGQILANVVRSMLIKRPDSASQYVREWDGFCRLVRESNGLFDLQEFLRSQAAADRDRADDWNALGPCRYVEDITMEQERNGRRP